MSPSPGHVLRLSMLAWGLGDRALGNRAAAAGWLIAELVGLLLVATTALAFADTTWYLLPFLLGAGFIGLWALQAIRAFRRAEDRQAARPPTPRGSPAAAVAWLTLPLLVWGTGFWLIGAAGASPGAVLDRFLSDWPSLASATPRWNEGLTTDPARLTDVAGSALDELGVECRAGALNPDCRAAPANLLHDVRIRLVDQGETRATAIAESVDYVQRPTSILFVFNGTELVPVARGTLLRLELAAAPAEGPLGLRLGARRWQIVSASR